MLPIDDANNVARVGDKCIARREVRVADRRSIQLFCSRNE